MITGTGLVWSVSTCVAIATANACTARLPPTEVVEKRASKPLSSPDRHLSDIPTCVSQPRLALGGATSSSGKGDDTDTIFSPNTSPSPHAIKPCTKENGLIAHVLSSSISV